MHPLLTCDWPGDRNSNHRLPDVTTFLDIDLRDRLRCTLREGVLHDAYSKRRDHTLTDTKTSHIALFTYIGRRRNCYVKVSCLDMSNFRFKLLYRLLYLLLLIVKDNQGIFLEWFFGPIEKKSFGPFSITLFQRMSIHIQLSFAGVQVVRIIGRSSGCFIIEYLSRSILFQDYI